MHWMIDHWAWLALLVAAAAIVLGLGHWASGALRAAAGAAVPDEPSVDPVSGEPVLGGGVAVVLYRGRPYCFNSRENRDRFEANPARFLVSDAPAARSGGGHGCC